MNVALATVDYERIALSFALIATFLVVCLAAVVRVLRGRQKPEIDRLHRDLRDVKHEVNNLITGAQGLPIMNRRLELSEQATVKMSSELSGVRDGIARLERMTEMMMSHVMSTEGKAAASPPTDGGGA